MGISHTKKQIKRCELAKTECVKFNSKYPVGTDVILTNMLVEKPLKTKTITEAFVDYCGEASVFVKGVGGYFLLERVTPIEKGNNNAKQ